MSYEVWSVNGFGFCVDDIKTTPEKILKLAALNENTFSDLREYLDSFYEEGYKDDELTMDDFYDFEGEYGEMGLSAILRKAIKRELSVEWADNFDGDNYILYCPSYPWTLQENESNLTKEDVIKIFEKYIKILTDEPIIIGYYSVENGG